jgi:hypothetical protein
METVLPFGKKFIITLTDEDRQKIEKVLADPNTTEIEQTRARVLLLSSAGKFGSQICRELGVARSYVSRVKHDFLAYGLDYVLTDRRGGQREGDATRYITPEIAEEAKNLHEDGASFRELAKKFDFSPEGIRLAIERKNREGDELNR